MQSWKEVLGGCLDRRVASLFALGFSAGLPLLLIFSTLSIWLSKAGMARADITLLSWAALGYGFKFVWAPLIDKMPVPYLAQLLGQRRSWLLVAQLAIVTALLGMAHIDPAQMPIVMACFAVMLGFSSATQDIVIDAYRIEVADVDLQALLAAAYMSGYRVGMILAGAGALEIAGLLDSTGGSGYDYDAWRWTYSAMAGAMLVCITTTFLVRVPSEEFAKGRDVGFVKHVLRNHASQNQQIANQRCNADGANQTRDLNCDPCQWHDQSSIDQD